MENKKPKEEPVDCHKCTNAYWGCFNYCADYKIMKLTSVGWSMMDEPKKSNIFTNPDTISMWVLIADGKPIFKTEFHHIINDGDLYILNNGARGLYKELKNIKS